MEQQQEQITLPQTPKSKRKSSSFKVLIVIGIIVVIAVGVYAGNYLYQQSIRQSIKYPDLRKCSSDKACEGYCDEVQITAQNSNSGVTVGEPAGNCDICISTIGGSASYCRCGYCGL